MYKKIEYQIVKVLAEHECKTSIENIRSTDHSKFWENLSKSAMVYLKFPSHIIIEIRISNWYKDIMVSMNIELTLINTIKDIKVQENYSKSIQSEQLLSIHLNNPKAKTEKFNELLINFTNNRLDALIKVHGLEIFCLPDRNEYGNENKDYDLILSPINSHEYVSSDIILPPIIKENNSHELTLPLIIYPDVEKKPTSSYENLLNGLIISCYIQNIMEKIMLIELFNIMGAVYYEEYCDSVHVLISDGTNEELLREAKREGANVISQLWVYDCIDARKKLEFEIYSIL